VSTITISPLRAEDIAAVANLHAAELQYSFNSKMGANHLACIYRAMSALPGCFVGVASDAGVPVGVVSGTLDVRSLKPAILQSLGWRGKLRMIGGVLRRPSAASTLLGEMKSRPPVKVGNREVNACLTAIAVAASHRRKGLASQLVTALEEFFRAHGVSHYWLDTIAENTGALVFYQKLGFTEVTRLGRTVVLLKRLTDVPRAVA
jgi:ribosomal protein S18 acetylase RimI-like enzyme